MRHPHGIRLADLVAIDEQKRAIDANTRQFVAGLPANNVLLTGSRGTGKSSLVKALLHKSAKKGLRVIEVDKDDLIDLPDIVDAIAGRPEKFIIFCDDLSFEAGETAWTIAQEQGLTADAFGELMTQVHTDALAQAVADGLLTQEQADARLAHMNQMRQNGPNCPLNNP